MLLPVSVAAMAIRTAWSASAPIIATLAGLTLLVSPCRSPLPKFAVRASCATDRSNALKLGLRTGLACCARCGALMLCMHVANAGLVGVGVGSLAVWIKLLSPSHFEPRDDANAHGRPL